MESYLHCCFHIKVNILVFRLHGEEIKNKISNTVTTFLSCAFKNASKQE